MEKKEDFKHASLKYFNKNKDTISDKEADIWDFMATSKIESMTYKDGENDTIIIKLNSIMFK